MKGQFVSRQCAPSRVFKALLLVVACLAGFVAVMLAASWIKQTLYDPWRSTRILEQLNDQTQTPEEQLQIVERALACNPRNFDARLQFAFTLAALKEYDRAASAWAYVSKWGTAGLRDTSFADQGVCLLSADKPAQAIVCLQETIRRRPDHVAARVFLAAAYAELGLECAVHEELVKLANIAPDWLQRMEAHPEYPDERKAALMKLEPYMKDVATNAKPQ